MSRGICVRVPVSVHADQVVTALTPSKSFHYHMKRRGSVSNLTLLSFKAHVCVLLFNGAAPCGAVKQ